MGAAGAALVVEAARGPKDHPHGNVQTIRFTVEAFENFDVYLGGAAQSFSIAFVASISIVTDWLKSARG